MNIPAYLHLSILEMSKIVIYELHETKIWLKSKIILPGYRQLCSPNKYTRHLHTHFKRS